MLFLSFLENYPITLALADWKAKCPEGDLVFPKGNGNPINASNFYNRVYLPAIEKAGIKKRKFHTFRHTYASILIDQGENIRYVSAQMGHSKVNTMLDIYGHFMKSENPEAARRLGNVIFLKTGSKAVANLIEEKSQNA